MAGVGFKLKKLIEKGNLKDSLLAYFHAIMISSGPWLITVLFLGLFNIIFKNFVSLEAVKDFRSIIIYNFSFSLILSSPIAAISTRFLADCIYHKDLEPVSGMLFGSLVIYIVAFFPVGVLFYTAFLNADTEIIILSVINFMLVLFLWQTIIFLTTIKHYRAISVSFLAGFTLPMILNFLFLNDFSQKTLLTTFNLGIALILSSFFSLIFKEFPDKITYSMKFFSYFKKYWDLALAGLLYNLGIWVDKWIMWSSAEAVVLPNNLVLCPPYDSAMFIAFLNVIPALGMFMLSQETKFYENYLEYSQGIQNHANLSKIQSLKNTLVNCLFENSRNLVLLQAAVSLSTIFMAPYIFRFLGINYFQLGIFRYGVLGSSLQVLMLFATIVLSYFDERKSVLRINFLFFASNAIFTLATLKLGFSYYGYGYFLSNLITFVVAAILLERYLNKVIYHTFITNNPAVMK